ncbi:hypothetical protein JCM3775_004541 [Rhodotorula graminis]
MTAAPAGPFRGPTPARGTARDAHKQAVFSQFKAVCVPLLELARAPSSGQATRTIIDLAVKLTDLLRATPTDAFSTALANYAFFPLSALLRPPLDGRDRGDRVLEVTMLALAALIVQWRAVGMDVRVRQELWTMTALSLGGPLDPSGPSKGAAAARAKGKGKAVERTEEAELAMVEAFLALMRPDERGDVARDDGDDHDDDPLGERIDWDRVDASFDKPPQRASDPPPPVPILFHTLTTLLALAAEPTSLLQLQLSSLDALQILFTEYLAHPAPSATVPHPVDGPSPLLATALPGTASTLSRVALSMPSSSASEYGKSTRRQASPVVVAALQTLARVIVETVGDEVTRSLRSGSGAPGDESSPHPATLEELVEASMVNLGLEAAADEGEADDALEPPDHPSAPAPAPPPTAAGPVIPTPSWLAFTLTSLSTLFAALSPLSTHDSAAVRIALVALLSDVLALCSATLGTHAEIMIEGLLALASDEWDAVRAPARRALLAAFGLPRSGADDDEAQHPLALAARIVQRRLAALPGALRRQDEHAVRRGAAIVRTALDLVPAAAAAAASASSPAAARRAPSPLHGVDRWSWALLGALEVERVPAAGRAAEGGMALAWITSSGDSPSSSAAGVDATAYPPVRLRGVNEAATVRALEALWEALGRASAAAGQAGEAVDQFAGVALGPRRDEGPAVSALWVLDGVLKGMGGAHGARGSAAGSREQRQVFKRATRAVLALMEDLEDASAEEEEQEPAAVGRGDEEHGRDLLVADDDADERSSTFRLVEHKKGVTDVPSLDAYNPVAARATSRDQRASHLVLLSSFSLRLLATSAAALSSSFQPFLMQSLYHVLAHLSPTTHPFLRAHAQHTLALISDATAYASPHNLVLANVDYVVNSVSQRLSVSRLEPNAPLVLVEMIRLVGKPIVPMVQDLVDDVFEALDDYHGYEEVTVGLWAVLDALLKVMVEDLPATADDLSRRSAATKDVPRPVPADDLRDLEQWLAHRLDEPPVDAAAADGSSTRADLPEEDPQQPFASTRQDDSTTSPPAEGDDGKPVDPSFASDAVAPPTRPQRVTAQILHKALYFLSHPSAFLRARVLSLFASAVPLLTLPPLSDDAAAPTSTSTPSPPTASTREADLLPVVHRAWPLILLRLAPPPREEPPVALEAVRLVQALAEHTGEYMSRRIADDVWPRFAALLVSASGSVPASASAAAGLGRYSAQHRLHAAVLSATRAIARHVPMKEPQVWDAALVLRRFVVPVPGGGGVEPELRALARGAYEALGRQNADAVWCVLRGTVGGEGAEGLPRWLGKGWEGVEASAEVEEILAQL